MSGHPTTIKVKPWGEGQGDHVLINEEDFDASLHEMLDGSASPVKRAELEEQLNMLPGNHTDPEYVVNGMRGFYGDLFTPEDEKLVRELVKAPAQPPVLKPSEGKTVDQLKAALTELKIDFPANAVKADLQALLDGPTT